MGKSYQLKNALHPLMKTHSRKAFFKSQVYVQELASLYDVLRTSLSKSEKSQPRGNHAIKSLSCTEFSLAAIPL